MKIELEWDENKNIANIKNHDIDFCDAWKIFNEPILKKIDNRENYGEERWIGLGRLEELIIIIVYTYRAEKIRIISIRRANRNERKTYETYCFKEQD
jgi:uncharacterized DUF497 family protein